MKRIILKESSYNRLFEINDLYNSKDVDYIEQNNPLLDKDWGNSFSLRTFVQQKTVKNRIRYCEQTLPYIGCGNRRIVFKLNNNYVLKLTMGEHRYQTKNEYDSSLLMSGEIDIFPRILFQSKDFSWSIVEYAKPMRNADCERILGLPIYPEHYNEPSLAGFQLWAEVMGRRPSKQNDYTYFLSLNKVQKPWDSFELNGFKSHVRSVKRNNCDAIYRQLMKTNPFFKKLYDLERTQRADVVHGTDLNNGANSLRCDAFGVVNRNGKEFIVLSDAGFDKPFDTRKLKKRYNIDSPQVPPLGIFDDFHSW